MALGFAAAIAAMPLPFVDAGHPRFGDLHRCRHCPRPAYPDCAVAALVGFFAFFHGHAHGGELGEAGAWEFALGFVVATAVLHAAGIALGLGFARFGGKVVSRIAGAATAIGGLWLAFGA